jgi:soluble lytic murein transglycosylase-like protein
MMASLSAQFGGDYAKALAAYNAGAGAVQSAVAAAGGNWLSHMPAETRNYVAIIMR